MGQFNLNYNYYSGLSDKALTNDGEAIWDLLMVQAKLHAPNYGDGNFLFPIDLSTVIGHYLADNFDEGDAGYTDSKWHNVEESTNIIDLLDKIQNGDTAKTKELFKLVDMDIKYNKELLQVTPYYSFKEAIDQCRNIAERKAKEEAERIAKEEAERKAKEEAERKAKEEAERKAKEEAERIAKEEAERIAKEEAERKSKEEAERKAKEETERIAKEEAERKAKEEAERNSYKSLIEDFVSDIKVCEYKDGIIFGKKKKIHYVANPITKRIWNAVVNKSSETDFDDNDFVPQKELGTFLENLNSYYSGKIVFEYLHKNIHALVHLQVYEKQDKNACFVYIKEEN
ncbi:hypothetical protein [Prevotella sp. LMAG:51]|uniref:hypothetical protein n=1 Tax=Prevotella sp. LMAG:51 TaxID=1969564 RepID=UPI00258035DB|nr:hypothetical protein [Prevotella sp. LMAG:51]